MLLRRKILETRRRIYGFTTEGKVDFLLDKFEEIMAEIEKLKIAESLRYALSMPFIE